jgi:Na+-driven multidrug efflux pump
LFSNDPEVIEAGSNALRVMALAEPFLCVSIVTNGILRGAGDTKMPFLVSLAGMWGVRQICAWFLAFQLGLGLTGAFAAMALDIIVRCVLIRIRYMRMKWLR